jgi:hypothetical protein
MRGSGYIALLALAASSACSSGNTTGIGTDGSIRHDASSATDAAPQGQDGAITGADAMPALDAQPLPDATLADASPAMDASSGQDANSLDASGGPDIGPHPSPGVCLPDPTQTGNSMNVGAYCTRGGHECAQYNHGPSFACAIDLDPQNGDNLCVKLFCSTSADCGEQACCTGNGSPVMACVPLGCVATDAGVCP